MSRVRLEHALRLKNKIIDYNDINPDINVGYTTPTMAQNGGSVTIEAFLTSVRGLYMSQIEKLKTASKMAINDNEDMLMGILEHYIKDESEELCKVNRILKRLNNAKKYGDMSFLDREDKELHCKYKEKEKKRKYEY